MTSVAPRRTRLARADRMEQTLTVARALFAEQGYSAVTMDEVAAEVGVTKPLLYNYFGNKEHLYIACMERAGDALTATLADSVAATRTPDEALRAGMHAFFAFLDSDRAAWTVLFDETLPRGAEVSDRVADYRTQIADLVSISNASEPYHGNIHVGDIFAQHDFLSAPVEDAAGEARGERAFIDDEFNAGLAAHAPVPGMAEKNPEDADEKAPHPAARLPHARSDASSCRTTPGPPPIAATLSACASAARPDGGMADAGSLNLPDREVVRVRPPFRAQVLTCENKLNR